MGGLTFHSLAGTLKVGKVDGDGVGPGGGCSPWHDESGSQRVPLPTKQTAASHQTRSNFSPAQ